MASEAILTVYIPYFQVTLVLFEAHLHPLLYIYFGSNNISLLFGL